MTHAEIIKKLGDYELRYSLGSPDKPIPIGTIGAWKSRDQIPWKHRPALARMAKERGILLPADFLLPQASA